MCAKFSTRDEKSEKCYRFSKKKPIGLFFIADADFTHSTIISSLSCCLCSETFELYKIPKLVNS